ncbi:FtsK/SpoIIIE domain-containing protein [Helicobacter sp. NHP22-001]|uniref:FtsK/SpoIIIE domain-containing protein n=1 Tax=Helicobacter sp. NHP22-001 TaxID=3040202 RepID=UPI00244D96C6|nr:FtsK/SpoIIIE domain-containing protein [Helicobacter sp. NHP22-001]GMB96916.1 ATP-binding protein [Helicobacter sp. NHP22-001]
MDHSLKNLDNILKSVYFEDAPASLIQESLDNMQAQIKQVRAIQPQLGGELHVNHSKEYPDFLALGLYEVRDGHTPESFEPFYAPKTHTFPPPALFGDSPNTPRFMRETLMRLISTIPLTHLEVVLVDALSLGGIFALARRLLKKDNDFIYKQKILTEGDEIKEALKSLYSYLKVNLQEKLANYKDFMHFNRNNPDILEVRALFLSGVDALDGESLHYLQKIVRFGPSNGVLSFIHSESEGEASTGLKALMGYLENYGQDFEAVADLEHVDLNVVHDFSVSQEHLNAFAHEVEQYYSERKQVKRELDVLQRPKEFWSKQSTFIVSVPIGWDKDHREVLFEIGGDHTGHHTLVCGKTGSGKSNFLNVLIQNLAFYYSPDELRLFLLDYKEGVEFNAYANPPLEHAELVSVQASVSFGIEFLESLNNEMIERSEKFKECGVKDFKGYRHDAKQSMPRIVVVIDEFQVLFAEVVSKENEHLTKLLQALLKKGRSYGIHLIFSTQTMRGTTIPQAMKTQIDNRMALAMDAEDSMTVLGNEAAGDLTLKERKGIYSNVGEKKTPAMMTYTTIPYAANEKLPTFIQETIKAAQERGTKPVEHELYNGELPVAMPTSLQVQGAALQLGVGAGYKGKDFILHFEDAPQSHLLMVSNDLATQIAWLQIIGKNLQVTGKQLYYYNASKQIASHASVLQPFGIVVTHTNAQLFAENLAPGSFILIDSLDEATDLHRSKGGSLGMWQTFLEKAMDNEQHFIVFASSLKNVMGNHELKPMLEHFRYRIIFKSNKENLEKAIYPGEIRAELSPVNARFIDKTTDQWRDFRPYSLGQNV